METRHIRIKGARVHNLKNVNLELPKNQLICFTGVSGSGKSSLAFDTLYAEGQRRYVASLSAYARQFLGQIEKPDVDQITGLAPTISISQKTGGQNPRSTVGTVTEIYDYLRILFARCGILHCIECGTEIGAQTRDQIVDRIISLSDNSRIHVLAPVVSERRGEYNELFQELLKDGYVRVRVDSNIYLLEDPPELDRYSRHNIEVVIDRLVISDKIGSRLNEAVDAALRLGDGALIVSRENTDDWLLSANFDCPKCGISYQEPTPQMFSFNNPQGMCRECGGLGNKVIMSEKLMIPDPSKSIAQGAIEPLGDICSNRWRHHLYEGAAEYLDFTLDTPWNELNEKQKDAFLNGLGDQQIEFTYTNQSGNTWSHDDRYEGALAFVEERFRHGNTKVRRNLATYARSEICSTCNGARLRKESLGVRINNRSLPELTSLPIEETCSYFNDLQFDPERAQIAEDALKEIRGRLQLLVDIGLGYLTLDRGAHTLSGGESQRIRLASQIGSGLVGVLYILDEPSIGLHHRDNKRLLSTLQQLRDMGNTVIVVEHDEETMHQADLVVDFGPGAGERGGELVGIGSIEELTGNPRSVTGEFLSGNAEIGIPENRRLPNNRWLKIRGARHNNLKDIDVDIPLGLFTCVTGVSGSGKSSLANDILFKALDRDLHRAQNEPGEYDEIEGINQLDKIIRIDQKPIGRTPRSNPATYTDLFTPIRQLFAQLPEAKLRGYKQGRFSFNVRGGRCEACDGNGANLVEMEFLADVWITCEICEGRRFNRETLTIKYRDQSITDVLNMEVEEALGFFTNIPQVQRILQTLNDVGLGYIKLGQPAPTLSGGEAQRVKLAKELCRRSTGRTLYLLDEPTTGLHFADIEKLLAILHQFADQGNTVLVIEHNMDVIKTADYIVDMGPEGGAQGGEILCVGSPEEIAVAKDSHTGYILKDVLGPSENYPSRKSLNGKNTQRDESGFIDSIEIVGARMHNLQNIDVNIPRERMTVVSGLSGSGKSTLAFDTIYAEGQRRYVESLSAYARQFLEQMQKPKVERISGLSPAIAIEQKSPSKNPRSTVGTVTEIYDYIRALYAVIGVQYCPQCAVPVDSQTAEQIVDRICLREGQRLLLLAPMEPQRNEGYDTLLRRAREEGFARIRIDGKVHSLDEEIDIERRHRHQIELVIDRVIVKPTERSRLNESVERALDLSGGEILVVDYNQQEPSSGTEQRYSRRFSCPTCGRGFQPLVPQSFSFNHQEGMCQICEGLGTGEGVDRNFLISDRNLSIREGAISLWGPLDKKSQFTRIIETVSSDLGIDLDCPFSKISSQGINALLYGIKDHVVSVDGVNITYEGILPTVDHFVRHFPRYKSLLQQVPCSACEGTRLRTESRSVKLRNVSIADLTRKPIDQCAAFMKKLNLDERETEVAGELLNEVRNRLGFLDRVGLGYITLERGAGTLSGGEAQRIRLAGQIGSGLTGVLYLLDEPTIGLHPRDNRRLLSALEDLRDLGNTLVLVEHDRDTLKKADFIVDLGPGAGREGGYLVANGPPQQLIDQSRIDEQSHTVNFLSGNLTIPVPKKRRRGSEKKLRVVGARENNLKDIDVALPLECMVCVSGVSGSGKSSLVQKIIYNGLASLIHKSTKPIGQCDNISGGEHFDKVVNVDQSPLGQSPRSTPATIMGIFDHIRQLFARMPDARVRGLTPGRFSFNRPGGRCESCAGLGSRCIEMHFLPDVWVRCDSCQGKRYMNEILQIQFKGRNISDILDLTVSSAILLFDNIANIHDSLRVMEDVGLGYLSLGQASTTFSGGEAQRLKLAGELARPKTGNTLYIMDEPTTGLHFADVQKLLQVIQQLVNGGNTVIVVEHNMEVIKNADYVVDMGPEGGNKGGKIVVAGTPEKVAKSKRSHTGRILKEILA